MAIDREINQRVEAYGNNPGALQKRYAASKELIDLLALQRLKTQKDDAARQIQMEMAQMPGTIKAQREQELMGQSVQDLSKRTADTMRNMAQKKQMKSMQKGVAERTKGLASLAGNPQMAMAQQNRPQQPQPQRMQAGGIVALAEGGDVEVKREIQRLINMGYSDEEIKGMLSKTPEEVIKSVRRQQQEDMRASGKGVPAKKGQDIPVGKEFDEPKKATPKKDEPSTLSKVMKGLGAIGEGFGDRGRESTAQAKRTRQRLREALTPESVLRAQETGKYEYDYGTKPPVTAPPAVAKPSPESVGVLRSDATKESTDSIVNKLITPQEAPVAKEADAQGAISESDIQRVKNGEVDKAFNLREELDALPELKAETVDREDADKRGMDVLEMFGRAPKALKDPEDAGRLAKKESYEDYKREEKDKERRAGLTQLEAIDKKQQDPDMLRRERLMAGLGGAARGGLGGYGRGSSKMGAAQARSERERQIERMGVVKDIQASDTALVTLAKTDQKDAIERQTNKITNAMNTLSGYETTELQTRATEATNRNATSIANYEGKINRIEMLADDAQNKIENRIATGEVYQDAIDQAMDSMKEVSERLDELTQEAVRVDPIVGRIKKALNKELQKKAGLVSSDPDPKKVSELERQLVERIEQVEAGMLLASPKLYERFNSLKNAILKAEGSRDRALLPPEDEAYVKQFSG